MARGIGGVEFASTLPDWLVALAGVVTQLGDMWFVVLAILVVYGLAVRRGPGFLTDTPLRDCLYLLALAVGAYAFTLLLKHAFALPRPPGAATATRPVWLPALAGAIYESLVTADGFGFPSGHALKTTVVYGAAALTFDGWRRRRRFVGAAGVVLAVAASRVLLGVHYVVDVVAGVGFGLLFLGVVTATARSDPTRASLLAGGLGALGFAVTGSAKAALVVAVALAALAVWTDVPRRAIALATRG